ncbi:ribonuclease HII [Flavobacteriaceae bacterium LSUCC0859]|nr:ribonuclease HII [Flavobacteriaceae bacterium LSUCC0859]
MLSEYNSNLVVAGTDEAGRGCLCGPVTAAAVILPKDFYHPLLNDSKKMSEIQREILAPIIKKEAISYAIAHIDPKKIDEINILNASILAMHQSLKKLSISPEFIIVDGNRFKPFQNIAYQTIVKGDGKYLSIAAASVLAKTERDQYMHKLHLQYPQYSWDKNKGYPTRSHRKAIVEHGMTNHHRKSFRCLPLQQSLDL